MIEINVDGEKLDTKIVGIGEDFICEFSCMVLHVAENLSEDSGLSVEEILTNIVDANKYITENSEQN